MKKLFTLFFATLIFATSFAQQEDYKKPHSLGISVFFSDFQTAADLRKNGLASVLKENKFLKSDRINPGLAINYLTGISKHLDFMGTLGGSFVKYPFRNHPTSTSNSLLSEVTAGLNLKLLSDRHWLTPFVDFGVGASNYKKYFAAFIPVGTGLQINLADELFIIISNQYRIPVTENASYHFYHSIGMSAIIHTKKEPALMLVEIPEILDRDGDGIVDSLDACPDQAGLAVLQGCPDKDGDGIADKDDKCPDVAGLAKYQGCPIPDTDRDGINDEEDKCPNIPGVARYQGCPIPDTDKDGVNDEEDKCPNEAGPASNYGCPVIDVVIVEKVNKAAQNIFFSIGSAKLLAKSFKSLKDVVQIMNDNPSYKIDVDGHTSNTGGTELNQRLSDSRANSVKQYLINNGVDEGRITATGYGEDRPIADNNTLAGRAKNRRVEMHLKNY